MADENPNLKEFVAKQKEKQQEDNKKSELEAESRKQFEKETEAKYKQKFMSRKKKPVDVRDVAVKVIKDYKKDDEYKSNLKKIGSIERWRRYQKSRTGAVSRGVSHIINFVRNPVKSSYGSSYQEQKQKIQRIRQMQPQQPLNQDNFAWVFSDFRSQDNRVNVPQAVEREIMSVGNSSAGFCGDFEARKMEKEIFSNANFAIVLPTFNVEGEVQKHAHILSRKSFQPSITQQMEADIMNFGNILNSSQARKRRRR